MKFNKKVVRNPRPWIALVPMLILILPALAIGALGIIGVVFIYLNKILDGILDKHVVSPIRAWAKLGEE